MWAIERYPELFGGVVIGAPAMRTGDSNLGIEYTLQDVEPPTTDQVERALDVYRKAGLNAY